jgi:iron(III) transport system substrate-binding protein
LSPIWRIRPGALTAAVLALAALLTGCAAPSGPSLTLYSAQHAELAKAWVDGFTRETGIAVKIRQGGDFELANQIVAEGDASPADVFITENTPALSLLSAQGRLAGLGPATLDQAPAAFRSSAGDWVGNAGRSTVVIYNPALLPAAALPASILDLAKPEWKGRVGIAPGGADFQAIVSAVFAVAGDDAARAWLAGLKQNAQIYQNNITIMKGVNTGAIAAGITYHYYWYRDRSESGADSGNARLAFLGGKDAGGFLSVSGGGVVSSSRNKAQAEQLVAYLSSRAGQQILADGDSMEYPVAAGVAPNPQLKPFGELDPPAVDLNTLNGPKVIGEMQRAGLL